MPRTAVLGSVLLVVGVAVVVVSWLVFGSRGPAEPLPPRLMVPAYYADDATLLRLVTWDTVSAVVVVAPGVQTLGTSSQLYTRDEARWLVHGFAFTTADSVRADMPLRRDTLVIEHRARGYAVGSERFAAGASAVVYWDWASGWGAAEPLPSVESLPLSASGRAELAAALATPRAELNAVRATPAPPTR